MTPLVSRLGATLKNGHLVIKLQIYDPRLQRHGFQLFTNPQFQMVSINILLFLSIPKKPWITFMTFILLYCLQLVFPMLIITLTSWLYFKSSLNFLLPWRFWFQQATRMFFNPGKFKIYNSHKPLIFELTCGNTTENQTGNIEVWTKASRTILFWGVRHIYKPRLNPWKLIERLKKPEIAKKIIFFNFFFFSYSNVCFDLLAIDLPDKSSLYIRSLRHWKLSY